MAAWRLKARPRWPSSDGAGRRAKAADRQAERRVGRGLGRVRTTGVVVVDIVAAVGVALVVLVSSSSRPRLVVPETAVRAGIGQGEGQEGGESH